MGEKSSGGLTFAVYAKISQKQRLSTHPVHHGRLLHPKFYQQPSFMIKVYLIQLLLTFLPHLPFCPPSTRPVGVVLAAAGQAGPGSTDPGPHDPLGLIAGGHVA